MKETDLLVSASFSFLVTCDLCMGNPANAVYRSGATDSLNDTTDSAQWVDLHRRSLWWPEFEGSSLLSCSEMENSLQHIYDQIVPHYTAAPYRSLLFVSAHQAESITDCVICACVYSVHIFLCVCLVSKSPSKTTRAILKPWIKLMRA